MRYFLLLGALLGFSLAGRSQTDTTTIITRSDSALTNRIPVFSISGDELESDQSGQDVSGLLQSARDLYANTAGFHFGPARFRIRGYSSENMTVLINGIRLNDVETGFASFANWGGLNDVTRLQESRPYLQSSRYNFSGVGGYTNMETKAGSFRKGTSLSYASTNRIFRHRVMFTHSTGLNSKGWAFTVSGSRRWAEEGFVEGTFFDAWSYFLAVEKRFNSRHSLNFVGFGAPIRQGRQGFATQEAYDLAGNNFYNPNWGYQNGEKRNARVSSNHIPMLMLTHTFRPTEKFKLNTSAYYTFGKNGYTGLNWYDAADPRPDYYRYLPSYYAETDRNMFDQRTEAWQNDENTRQIDWERFYFANRKNLYQVENPDGKTGEVLIGNRSKYIVEELHIDRSQYGANMLFGYQKNDRLHISGGITGTSSTTHNYREVEDLLGGDFWVDVDQFAEQDFIDNSVAQNDLNNINNVVREGEKFGYNYKIHNRIADAFFQAEYSLPKFDMYLAANASNTTFWREGLFRNGRFPENSFGNSEKQNFTNGGIKGGITWKITGRHYVYANGGLLSRAPMSRDAYLSPRTRSDIIKGLQSEEVLSYDLNYQIRYPNFKLRASWFQTEFRNQVWFRNFYHDVFRNFVNYTMTGVNQLHQGVELALEYAAFKTITFQLVGTKGSYVYNSRPNATIVLDNSANLLAENRTIYLKNYKIGGMPQTAVSLGARYNSSKGWWGGLFINFFDDIYLDVNPDRRSEDAVKHFVTTDPQWEQMLGQQKFNSAFTVDANIGRSWRIKGNTLNTSLNITNALNNQSFIVSGFEQLRYEPSNINKFPPKLVYNLGAIYNLVLSYRF